MRWFVLKTPVKIAESEITAFGKLYPMNARPTQPLNGRAPPGDALAPHKAVSCSAQVEISLSSSSIAPRTE